MKKTRQQLQDENDELRARLREAEDVLGAIRAGEVDALIVDEGGGRQIYTLAGADRSYRLLLESMNEGAVTVGADGLIVYCNGFFSRLLSVPLDRLIGARLTPFITESDIQHYGVILRECGRGELTLTAADGSHVPVYVSAARLAPEPGQELSCLIFTDMREQKRDEKILAEGRLSRLIFEQTAEAILICDEQCTVIRASAASMDLCGQSLIGRNIDDALPLVSPGGTPFNISQCLWKQVFLCQDLELRCSDGTVKYVIFSSARLVTKAGDFTGCVVTLTDITQRVRMQQSLQKSEERYRVMSESIPAIIWTSTPEGRTIDSNWRWYEYTGQAPDEQNQGGWKRFIHPDDLGPVTEKWRQALRTGDKYEEECRIRAKDGSYHWHMVQATPSRDSQGRITGWFGACIEIDEKKKAEEALRQSESRLNMVLESNAMGIFEIDLKTGIPHWNTVEWELFGLKPAETPPGQDTMLAMVHPDDRELCRQAWETGLHTGMVDIEFRIIRADAQERWLTTKGQFRYRATPEDGGEPLRFFAINFDITERKLAEQELFNAQERLQALLKALPVGVSFSEDASCARITGNSEVLKQFEVGQDDNLSASSPHQNDKGRLVKFYHDGRLIADTELPLQRAVAENRTIPPLEIEVLLPSGRRWFAEASGVPICDRQGKVIAGVAVTVDITDRKLAEKALRESEDRLNFALETIHTGTWDLNLTDHTANRTLNHDNIFGYDTLLPQWTYKKFLEHVLPEDRAEVERQFQHAITQQSDLNIECRIRRADGETRWIFAAGRHRLDASGKIRIMAGIVQDITERKSAAEALRQSKERLNWVLERTGVGTWMNEMPLNQLNWDHRTRELFFIPEGIEPSIDLFYDRLHPDDREPTRLAVEMALDTGTLYKVDQRAVHPETGQVRWIRSMGQAQYDSGGAPVRFDGINFDITFRKQAEQQLLKNNQRLELMTQLMAMSGREKTEILRCAFEGAISLTDSTLGFDCLIHDDGKAYEAFVSSKDAMSECRIEMKHTVFPIASAGLWAEAVRRRQPVIVNEYDAPDPAKKGYPKGHVLLKRFLAVPVLENKEAVLVAGVANKPDPYTDQDVAQLSILMNTVWSILKRKEAEEAVKKGSARLDILAGTASELLKTDTPQTVIDALCRRVMEFLDCQAFFNFLADEEREQLHLNAWAGIPESEAAKIEWLDYGTAVCGCAAREGRRIVAEYIPETPDIRTELVKSYGIQAYACHPLIAQETVLGTLSFGTRTRQTFSEDELSLMKAVADQVAIALQRSINMQNIARLNSDLERTVQELEVIFDTAPVGLSITNDSAGRRIRGNKFIEQLLAIGPGAELSLNAENRPPASYQVMRDGQPVPPRDLPVQRAARGEVVRGELLDVMRSDGSTLTLYSNAAPLRDDQGMPRGAVGAFLDISERKKYEESLTQALREKEVLLREIHHRVKNNMQVISSLIDLQADSLKQPELGEVFQEVRDRVRTMAMIHEKLYQTENLALIDFAEYASSLLTYIWRTHARASSSITLKQYLHPVFLSVEAAMPLGLIMNELSTNALKHAFPGRPEGEVTVALHAETDGRVCLRVSDNGVGLPKGANWRESPTLGLRLVQILTGQLRGTAEVSTIAGTEFRICFMPAHHGGAPEAVREGGSPG